MKLDDLQPNAAIRGVLPDSLVTVVSVQWFGSEALELTYKTATGKVANELLSQAAEANTMENFEPIFNKQLENLFIERIDDNEEIFMRLMNDDRFREVAAKHLMRAAYEQITAKTPSQN
ncbi:MAG: hypothetical protein IT328_11025 [Caldilineaceae bacterium]|nr:hypothetical protein [Caldilineaceae bacterium]